MKEKRVAFIGFYEYVNAMRFFGFECFGVKDIKEAEEKIKELEKENYSLIFVSQDVCPEDVGLDRVVVLPGIAKLSDDQYLKKEIIKAIGGEIDLSVKS
jgi:vacuolar-type H+-ATPase subunit F/Vma7